MIKKSSLTDKIKAKYRSKGKVSYSDQPNQIKAIQEMNTQLEHIRREFQEKDKNSQIHASQVILTA